MNESEKRRYQLLKEAKGNGRGTLPAVHPRYHAAYASLYPEESDFPLTGQGTFAVRVVLSVLLFALFVMADYKNVTVMKVDSTKVIEQIQTEPEAVTTFLNDLEKGIS